MTTVSHDNKDYLYFNEHDFYIRISYRNCYSCVAAVALSYFTFVFYYFYRFLLSSCVCQLIKFMMMIMRYGDSSYRAGDRESDRDRTV